MGKTKTAFVSDQQEALSGEEKYKARLKKKASEAEGKSEKVHISGLKGGQRIVAISAEPLPNEGEEGKPSVPGSAPSGKTKKSKVRGKKYKAMKAKIDRNKLYKLPDAIKLIKETSFSKFDGTLELHLKVKRDKFSERVTLPHSAGKEKKVEVA